MMSGELESGLHYVGWDVAQMPVVSLQNEVANGTRWAKCGAIRWEFQMHDVVNTPLPQGLGLVVVRHMLNHLGRRDVQSFLHNLKRAAPDLVLLTSTNGARNRDLDAVSGGSS